MQCTATESATQKIRRQSVSLSLSLTMCAHNGRHFAAHRMHNALFGHIMCRPAAGTLMHAHTENAHARAAPNEPSMPGDAPLRMHSMKSQ